MAPLNSVGQFLYGQILVTPPMPTASLSGQTIIVTGASAGLGLQASHHLVDMNVSNLILAVRNISKGGKAKSQILARAAKDRRPNIEVWELDLCKYASVLAFVDRCKTLPRLDAVLENAGILVDEFALAEGEESSITTNVLSTFLLGVLILPILRKNAEKFNITPRLEIVGSAVHFFAQKKELLVSGNIFDGLSDPKKADMAGRYFVSKLIVMFLVRKLAAMITQSEQEKGKPLVVINCVAPGLNKTSMIENDKSSPKIVVSLLGRNPDIGARTLAHGVASGRESHGQYLSECKVKTCSAFVRSHQGREIQRKLWSEMIERLEKVRPGLESLI